MKNNLEKLPPQNLEAEEALLGSLLIDKDAIIKVADIIVSDDFYKDIHRLIYETMLEVYEHREPIDILSISNRLEEKGQLDLIGGRSFLVELSNAVPSATHVASYAQITQRKATLRNLINSCSDITRMAYDEAEAVDQILDRAEQKLFGVSQRFLKQNFIPIQDVLGDAFTRIEDIHKSGGKLRGLPTGFSDLDAALGGLQPSDLLILAARPSVGKSALAIDIARQVAVLHKIPVGIFSLEMSREQIVDRMICSQANINLWKMRTGALSKNDEDSFSKIGESINILSEAPIFIDDSPMANVMEIRTKARRLQAEHGLGLLIIDYLQLMDGGDASSDNRVQEVSIISRSLKAIARELHIPVIALSQLSRATEARTPAIPKLADLRESGSLEQDSDVVLFIYRKSMDRGIKFCPPEEHGVAEIHVAKHRHGPAGVTVKLFFDDHTASFKNLQIDSSEDFSYGAEGPAQEAPAEPF
ncbi:MAG: replicative DNA helicase [Candidatus Parcubacteria bacterium]|nr:replicative DNA helicase [Candidatus Parcubacteria bacterium]